MLLQAQGRDEQPIVSSIPIVSLVGESTAQRESGDEETLECLINLDSVLIDDWESDTEDVEIEFEQDDEVVKYATHEDVEFDTSFIDQINQLARDDEEEGEIIKENEKEN
ncbi:hypothetical protein L1987_15189 [Smallanthus sonchifolius]|uniref:Uncharacterized protein n=1 Tax=Smallanthus sonchifolius TaxID=185202 RepID=A0ACB9J6F6_9ASTR|nr:hypothetical protein L1987_15189 [Smallanthus sonchifolius]